MEVDITGTVYSSVLVLKANIISTVVSSVPSTEVIITGIVYTSFHAVKVDINGTVYSSVPMSELVITSTVYKDVYLPCMWSLLTLFAVVCSRSR